MKLIVAILAGLSVAGAMIFLTKALPIGVQGSGGLAIGLTVGLLLGLCVKQDWRRHQAQPRRGLNDDAR